MKRAGVLQILSQQVGIFWFVGEGDVSLIHEGVLIDSAEDYGDFKTYEGGHYEFWENLRASGAGALKAQGVPECIVDHEYEDFPRGRIVYDIPRDTFKIYIDRKLNKREHLNQIKNAFGIRSVNYEVLFDHHYQSIESIK